MESREWSVGELASAIGVSVRTLHHYDQVGLLSASRRTHAEHRRYSDDDVRRLTQIVSLRSLGLSLEDIRRCLDGGQELAQTLRDQLATIDHEIALAQAVKQRLLRVLPLLAQADRAVSDDLLLLMEEITTMSGYYSKEDEDFLASRKELLGEEQIRSVQEEWPRLGTEMEAARLAGKDVDEADVSRLARRWVDLVELFTGGRAGVRQGLARRNSAEGNPLVASGVIEPETVAYAQRAIAALDSSTG